MAGPHGHNAPVLVIGDACVRALFRDPVGVHRAVAGLERSMFERWLSLFTATAEELFDPEIAAQFGVKARRIAGSLELAIFHRLGAPPDGLPPRRDTAVKSTAETEPCD